MGSTPTSGILENKGFAKRDPSRANPAKRRLFANLGRTSLRWWRRLRSTRHRHPERPRVLEVLADEPNLLRMNVCAGEGYEKLCPFLGIAVPNEVFPWVRPRI